MKKLKKLLKKLKLWMISLIILCVGILYYMNHHIVITTYKIPYQEKLTIVQLSDIHHMSITDSIINKIEKVDPDVVVITGDFIDRRIYDLDRSLEWVDALQYPIYYVLGNHEAWSGKSDEIIQALEQKGVYVLRNQQETVNGFNIIGYDDPAFKSFYPVKEQDGYNILLYHRPDNFNQFENIDLMLSGHAHGGQIRVFGRGLFAPGEGFLPEYTSGFHNINNMKLIISRGLGNSLFPFRILNQPEIVVIEIGS